MARALLRLAARRLPAAQGSRVVDAVERAPRVECDAEQRAAIEALASGPVLALTGSPPPWPG